MLITNDTLTNTQAHAMHARRGKSASRPTLHKYRHTKARAQAFPSIPFYGPPSQLVYEGTQQYLQLIGHTYSDLLSAAQRAAFAAIALTQPITLNDGSSKLVKPYAWFSWFNQMNYWGTFGPTFPVDPFAFPCLMDAPTIWNPPATPTVPTVFGRTRYFEYQFETTTTPSIAIGNMYCTIPYWRVRNRQTPPKPTIRVNIQPVSTVSGTGLVTCQLNLGGIVADQDWIHGQPSILRITSGPPNYVPSLALQFNWP